jgi:hypothetical protein
MAGTRGCEQCGTEFVPQREHDRFCSSQCRAAWNRAHSGDQAAEVRALEWSAAGMREVTERLSRFRPGDQAAAFSMISEAVWWVTIVDARLVRHYLAVYDGVLATRDTAERATVEGTLAGLRFVRNRIGAEDGQSDFIGRPARGAGAEQVLAEDVLAGWTWRRVPEPARVSLPPQMRSWEFTRHRAYETWLAGRPVGEVFGRVTDFLNVAAAEAVAAPDADAFARYGPLAVRGAVRGPVGGALA